MLQMAHLHPKPIPKIHDAVFGRIRSSASCCAPIGFPADYEVVKSTEPVVTYSGTGPTISTWHKRFEPNSATIAEGAQASARHAAQEDIWDLVWRKRTIYFLTVFVTGYLLLYPLLRDSYAVQELRNPLRVVSDTIRLIRSVLQAWLPAQSMHTLAIRHGFWCGFSSSPSSPGSAAASPDPSAIK